MKKSEGKIEGITIQLRFTKIDIIGQHSHAKSMKSQSKQQPSEQKKPLAEFDSPPSPPGTRGGNGLPALVCFWEERAISCKDSKSDIKKMKLPWLRWNERNYLRCALAVHEIFLSAFEHENLS
jgi:hypothetical protein